MARLALVAGLALAPFVDCRADDLASGNDLLATCENTDNPVLTGECAGFVRGISGSMVMADAIDRRKFICIPAGVTVGQSVAVVVKFLHDHPSQRHPPAVNLTWLSLHDAFSCIAAAPPK